MKTIIDEWSAIDILRLDAVDAEDRLLLVLREELIDAPILHEFACRCAERALARIDNPDARSVAAIEAKRKWLIGEISDDELAAARDAASDAAMDAKWFAEMDAERSAESATEMDAKLSATLASAWAAEMDVEWYGERAWQIAELMRMLKGAQNDQAKDVD